MHIRNMLVLGLVSTGLCSLGAAAQASEHCLVTQAIALAAYEARMDLLLGTDGTFDLAYRTMKTGDDAVQKKYQALIDADNQKTSLQNPESRGERFPSREARKAFFDDWTREIGALEAAQNSEFASYSAAFKHAMDADPNPKTRRRIAEIDAKWNQESHAACYWGPPK